MDVDVNTTKLTSIQSQSLTEVSDRVQIVYLSGPIRIFLSINEREETECSAHNKRDSCSKTSAAVTDSASAANKEAFQLHRPINEPSPESCGKLSYIDSTSSKRTANCPSTAMEEESSTVKQPDCNHPSETLSPFCPYITGNEILLRSPTSDNSIKAVIVKYFPATLSCCMVIRFVEPPVFNNTSECVLKLYDRRFSTQHREDWEVSPWTPELEKEYQDFVECGDAEEFFSYWDAEKERDGEWSAACVGNYDRWSIAKHEAYLQWDATNTCETEKKAYEHMAKLQGEDVPRVFGEVFLDQPAAHQGQRDGDEAGKDEAESTREDYDIDPQTINIPGILIQYINGFHLTDLHEHLPQDCWQSIVDTSVEKLHHIQECGILNRDLNTRSFMVDPLTHKVMMIDFGIVLFREDSEDDTEWERLQAEQDEEGALALPMQTYLKKRGGGSIVYKPSEQYWRLKYRYRGMEGEREGGTEEEEEYMKKHKDFVFEI
ncbi:hypothetical protein KCU91_g11758, partial [Aureobasidium melanogenum]